MKKVTIVGAGMMTGPMAHYLMDQCGYRVTMIDLEPSKAENVIGDRPLGRAVGMSVTDETKLDKIIGDCDIVISMVAKKLHPYVARSCIRCRKHMLTTSYETPELKELAKEAKKKGLLFLQEMGEDPGIDHFGTQMILDGIRLDGGKTTSLKSYGCGVPAFEHNNNPMGYKFSWDPNTVFLALLTPAAYYKKGKWIDVPGHRLFHHFHYVDLEDIGTFETYPNKDCRKYMKHFKLDENIEIFYRGILRYSGYCNNMRYLSNVGLIDSDKQMDFTGMTLRRLTSSLTCAYPDLEITECVAKRLKLDTNADFIHRFKWLGFFDDVPIEIKKGTARDVLLHQMLKKMSYKPHEKDMIIVHVEATAEFAHKPAEIHTATMKLEGTPYGYSAMSQAVGLPVGIGAHLILEGEINAVGPHIPPTLPDIYKPILQELATKGLEFKTKKTAIQ